MSWRVCGGRDVIFSNLMSTSLLFFGGGGRGVWGCSEHWRYVDECSLTGLLLACLALSRRVNQAQHAACVQCGLSVLQCFQLFSWFVLVMRSGAGHCGMLVARPSVLYRGSGLALSRQFSVSSCVSEGY
jgi:hypothetical protein